MAADRGICGGWEMASDGRRVGPVGPGWAAAGLAEAGRGYFFFFWSAFSAAISSLRTDA
jgi:hypothetical protein